MPTERFFRLPAGKQEVIREAALKEFKRVIPEDVSINRIIQQADISRGSFYTYFESKYDLLRWLIEDKVEQHQKFYLDSLEKNGGDIWVTLDEALEASLKNAEEGGFMDLIENLMDSKSFMYLFKQKMSGIEDSELLLVKQSYQSEIYRMTDKEKCPLDMDGFTDLIDMHMVALMMSIKSLYHNKMKLEDVKKVYRRQLGLLRYGACGQKAVQN